MEPKPPASDAVREWLQQLERRVDELERVNADAARRRRRTLWLIALAVVAYALFLQLVLNLA